MSKSLVLGIALGAGLASGAWAQGSARFDGDYMGELILTREMSECTRPALGSLFPLRVSRGEVRFEYIPRFGTTLRGRVADNGVFKASARLKHGAAQMTGRINGPNNVTANIVTPSCQYIFQTRR